MGLKRWWNETRDTIISPKLFQVSLMFFPFYCALAKSGFLLGLINSAIIIIGQKKLFCFTSKGSVLIYNTCVCFKSLKLFIDVEELYKLLENIQETIRVTGELRDAWCVRSIVAVWLQNIYFCKSLDIAILFDQKLISKGKETLKYGQNLNLCLTLFL